MPRRDGWCPFKAFLHQAEAWAADSSLGFKSRGCADSGTGWKLARKTGQRPAEQSHHPPTLGSRGSSHFSRVDTIQLSPGLSLPLKIQTTLPQIPSPIPSLGPPPPKHCIPVVIPALILASHEFLFSALRSVAGFCARVAPQPQGPDPTGLERAAVHTGDWKCERHMDPQNRFKIKSWMCLLSNRP